MAKLLSWLVVCSMFGASVQFYPNTVPGITDSRSQTHHKITELAINEVAVSVMDDSSTAYPSGYEALSYREVLKQLVAASAEPDLSDNERTKPDAHFDSEQFTESSRRIADLRRQAVSAIKTYRMETARNFAGRGLHTLQDFYSHSNWIELGNTDLHPGLDFRSSTEIASDTVARPNQTTCNGCIRFLLQFLIFSL